MENVVLTAHLILAVLLIGVVLLQRSEGGGLGMGGGGGGGVMTGRQAANALSRATWILAGGFLLTSIALTVLAARNAAGVSVVDRVAPAGSSAPAPAQTPGLPTYTPPPAAPAAGQPVVPPSPATPATAPAPAAETAPATAPTPAAIPPAPIDTAPAPAAPAPSN